MKLYVKTWYVFYFRGAIKVFNAGRSSELLLLLNELLSTWNFLFETLPRELQEKCLFEWILCWQEFGFGPTRHPHEMGLVEAIASCHIRVNGRNIEFWPFWMFSVYNGRQTLQHKELVTDGLPNENEKKNTWNEHSLAATWERQRWFSWFEWSLLIPLISWLDSGYFQNPREYARASFVIFAR